MFEGKKMLSDKNKCGFSFDYEKKSELIIQNIRKNDLGEGCERGRM